MPNNPVDPWLLDASGQADPFLRTDFNFHAEDEEINLPDRPDPVINVDPIQSLNPDVVVVEGDRVVPPAIESPVEPEGPEVVELPDGGTLTFQKTSKGWEAILDNGTSAKPEVFKGKNKNELMVSIAAGKLNATKKIRELNRELKLGPGGQLPAPPQQPVAPSKQLSADDVFKVKTLLDSNPDLAFDEWFQLRTGMSVDGLVTLAREGANAKAQISLDAINQAFVAANPDYYGDPEYKNYQALVRYLAKYKLNTTVPKNSNVDSFRDQLYHAGLWTVENLEEAFTELSNDGLLVEAPRLPKTPPEPAPTVEPVAPPTGRIVHQETRPRVALGIRSTDVTPVAPPAAPKAPSVEDIDNLDAEAFDKLYKQSLALARTQRRRN